MPDFKNLAAFKIVRNIRVFLGLEAGAIRGEGPESRSGASALGAGQEAGAGELERFKQRLAKTERENARLWESLSKTRRSNNRQLLATSQLRQRHDHSAEPPFFIIGQAKSGTSWLQSTLNSHPEILCLGEGKFFGRDFKTANPISFGRASLYSAFADSEDLRSWFRRNGNWTRYGDTDRHIRALVRLSVDYFFSQARARSGKPIVGDKTPAHVEYLEEIHDFYPKARIVHIIRDGRDQVVSLLFHFWTRAESRGEELVPLTHEVRQKREAYYENPAAFGADRQSIFDEIFLRDFARSWRDNVGRATEMDKRLFAGRYFEVRYEDLLSDPEAYFGEIIGFLGANSEREIVEECVRQNSFERLAGSRRKGVEDPRSFFRKGITGDWQNYFTERDKRIFKEEAGEVLIQLGYERDDNW